MLSDQYACPKCGVRCARTGIVQIGHREAAVFQCPTCMHDLLLEGRNYRCELVFAVDEDGLLFYPETQKFPEA